MTGITLGGSLPENKTPTIRPNASKVADYNDNELPGTNKIPTQTSTTQETPEEKKLKWDNFEKEFYRPVIYPKINLTEFIKEELSKNPPQKIYQPEHLKESETPNKTEITEALNYDTLTQESQNKAIKAINDSAEKFLSKPKPSLLKRFWNFITGK